jgi:hypothetical protein
MPGLYAGFRVRRDWRAVTRRLALRAGVRYTASIRYASLLSSRARIGYQWLSDARSTIITNTYSGP